MGFCIVLRQVADGESIVCADGTPQVFDTEDLARKFGRENIKGHLTTWWDVIPESEAREYYEFKD